MENNNKDFFNKIETSWQIIFNEFNNSIIKDCLDSDLLEKQEDIQKKWISKINLSDNLKLIEIEEILNSLVTHIDIKHYYKMYEEIDKLLKLNFDGFNNRKNQYMPIYRKYNHCSADLFQTLVIDTVVNRKKFLVITKYNFENKENEKG